MNRLSFNKAIAVTVCLIWLTGTARAQNGIRDSSIRFPMIGVSYGIYWPGGDLKDRFGYNSMAGFNFNYKTKGHFVFGATAGFIFGDQVDQSGLLTGLETSTGQIIGLDGLYSDVRVFERGYHIALQVGHIFNFRKPNPNSGIIVMGGPGFIQHKIRIEVIGNTVPALRNDYVKGYDRLTNGIELNEFIGFYYFGNRQLINFFGGFDFIQAFTENRRDYNYNAPEENGASYTDFLYGFRLGWILPLYKRKPAPFYFN